MDCDAFLRGDEAFAWAAIEFGGDADAVLLRQATRPTKPHQRQGYATRAVRPMRQLARTHALSPVWILIAPDNVASRLAVGRVGFPVVNVVDASPAALALDVTPMVRRYRWEVPRISTQRHAGAPAA